ncbi:MAG: TonB-dependent receptor, partial [Kiritimatiellae bacterium]|nr:TonB-dependent receptor [Kiritimatiellia bacterium]
TAPPFARLPSDIQDAINGGSFSRSDLELNEEDLAPTGGVGLVYRLTDAVNWVGHVGRAFRAPNQSDMLNFGQFTYGFNVPSGDLKPESSWSFESGLKAQTANFSGEILGYYTVLQDAIESRPGSFNGEDWIDANGNGVRDSAEDVYVKRNVEGDIEVFGVDVGWNAYLPETWMPSLFADNPLTFYGMVGYIRGKNNESGDPLAREFPLNGMLGFRVEDHRSEKERTWFGEVEAVLVNRMSATRIPEDRRSRDAAFKVNPQDGNSALLNGNGSVSGYALLNLRGGIRLREGTWLTLEVENATDEYYRVKDSRIDAPGINVIASLDIRF